MPERLDGLDKRLAVAIEHMNELQVRLGPVQRPEPPNVACAGSPGGLAGSPIAERLDSMAHRVGDITDMIQRIFGRLDI